MLIHTLISSLALLAASAQAQVSCGFPPKIDCLVKNAQYTLAATVLSTTQNSTGNPANYNATLAVQCLWATGQPGTATGMGIQGSSILVTSFGSNKVRHAIFTYYIHSEMFFLNIYLTRHQSNCPRGSNAEAVVGNTRIYFIHVRSNLPRTGENIIYSIVDVCVGGQEYNEANLKAISNVLEAYPSNRIDDRYRGPAQNCNLPKPDVENELKPQNNPDDPTVPKNAGKTFRSIFSLGITSLLILATLIVAY